MTALTIDPDSEHGEVFTRRWVVDLVLDLVGYSSEGDLGDKVIVEPSCGGGAFLLPIVERLAESCLANGRSLSDAGGAVVAFDLLDHNVEVARKAVTAKLLELGEEVGVAERLSASWVTTADFLLANDKLVSADFVVGNPPYIRLEDLDAEVSDAYRRCWSTMRGRADIYVGFFEKGLSMLCPEGRLGFICADRWMHNQYGGRLRELISSRYAVDLVAVMHDVDAFENDVSAYPAITILRNGTQAGVRVVDTNERFDEAASDHLVQWMHRSEGPVPVSADFEAGELSGWFQGRGLWPTGSPRQLELLADLEERFVPLEDPLTGTKIGIGVATGCDDVYIVTEPVSLDPDRLLPLLTAGDIATGEAEWSGHYLVNPWDANGLVDLSAHPGLRSYLEEHESRLRSRHVAKRRPDSWYRTIDRVVEGLLERPKLLLPDMKASSHPVLDPGGHYPHHNLYYIVSDVWDLEVLGGLLLSEFTNLFVGAYCVKMRGGTYRFQAQYLRKIRVPDPASIGNEIAQALREAFRERDAGSATRAASELFGVALPAQRLHSTR